VTRNRVFILLSPLGSPRQPVQQVGRSGVVCLSSVCPNAHISKTKPNTTMSHNKDE